MLKLNSYWLEEDLWKKLKRLVHSLNLDKNISFVGYINQGRLLEYYQNAAIFVHPSYHGGLPITILETMSCGIPTVATAVTGTSEIIVDGKNGFLFSPKGPEKLAKNILNLLCDTSLRKKLGKNARKEVEEKYNWNAISEEYEKNYSNIMEDSKMKIMFIHNKAIWYRIPFFRQLSTLYDVEFLFTHEKEVEGLDGINYVIWNNHFGIAFGLIPRLLKGDYDGIIVSGWSNLSEFIEGIICLAIAKVKKKPVIVWFEHWYPPIPDIRRKLASPLIRFIVKHSDACVAPGSKTKELVIKMGANQNKIFIAPNASIAEGKNEIAVREILGLEKKKIIFYFSRIIPRKGINYLVEAFSKLEKERDDIFLLICGEGDFMNDCKRLCGDLNIRNVYFTGFIEPEEKYSYFSAANVFVLPAVFLDRHAETWGLVLNEAMSVGKPVISTTAVASAYDLIRNGVNGFMVPEKDSDALYSAMKKILSDPELEKKMGEESKRIIEEGFKYENMAEGFRKAVSRVLKVVAK